MAARRSRRGQRRNQLVGIAIGVLIVVTIMIGMLAPNLGNSTSTSDDPAVIPTPVPTRFVIPTPDPDPQLDGQAPYVHSTGYFQVYNPAGSDWQTYELPEYNVPPYAGVIMQSLARLTVIYNYLVEGVEYETLADLNESYWTDAEFLDNWINYDSWSVTRREEVGDRLIIDFDLTLDGNSYLGRTTSWLENNFLYVSRLVVPSNNPALRDLLYEKVTPSLTGYPALQALPQTWPVYTDRIAGFALKHPAGWRQVAGGQGRPTTFSIPSGQVRVQFETGRPVGSLEEAEQWITDQERGVTLVQSSLIERDMGVRYQVAYSYQDAAGDPHSGLVVLLAGDDGTLYSANLQLETPDLNLLEVDETVSVLTYEAMRAVTQGFIVLPR